jgi:L-lactate dehydrogenase (cytochrome)
MHLYVEPFQTRTRRLQQALTIYDLRELAKRATPKLPFDYVDGGAEAELSLRRARQAFEDIEFTPSLLTRSSGDAVDTSRLVLGSPVALPFGIAPTGFTRLAHHEGEIAGAGAAASAGIPFCLSIMGTTSIEEVRAANPNGRNWFQLYLYRDPERTSSLIDRAAHAKFDTLVVTVDVPVGGYRRRDQRNGMRARPHKGGLPLASLSPSAVLNVLSHPSWLINFLSSEPLTFASMDRGGGTMRALLDSMFDPTVSFEDLAALRGAWPGSLVVKGVQSMEDARRLAGMGIDGIVLSNHGGRQLDRSPIPFHLLPAVVREVGAELEVMLDTGIMSGQDIVAAIALGARFTLIGRAYLYGLMAGGREGVDRAIQILSSEITRTMGLLGVSSLEELKPKHVRQLSRLSPLHVQ